VRQSNPSGGGFSSGRPPLHSNYQSRDDFNDSRVRRNKEESERLLEEASREARDSKKPSNFSDNNNGKPAEARVSERDQYQRDFINTPLSEIQPLPKVPAAITNQ